MTYRPRIVLPRLVSSSRPFSPWHPDCLLGGPNVVGASATVQSTELRTPQLAPILQFLCRINSNDDRYRIESLDRHALQEAFRRVYVVLALGGARLERSSLVCISPSVVSGQPP